MNVSLKNIFRRCASRRLKAHFWSTGDKNDELIAAAAGGAVNDAKFWLRRGADVNALLGYPLHCAIEGNHGHVAALLVKKGADQTRLTTEQIEKLAVLMRASPPETTGPRPR